MAFTFFSKKKKKKEKDLDAAFSRVTEEIQTIDNWEDPKKLEHYILDSCEQIIGTTKEIEAEKQEYRSITAHLNDIVTFETLPEEKKNEIQSIAKNIVQLSTAQDQYIHGERPIAEDQYLLMEENAEDVPSAVRRMLENERYQDSLSKNMRYLEGEKSRFEMERDAAKRSNKRLRSLSILLLISVSSMLVLYFLIAQTISSDISWVMMLIFLFGMIFAAIIFLQLQKNNHDLHLYLKKMNQTISLLNGVRIRYVNITRALDYTRDHYSIHTAHELEYLWNQYEKAKKEREQFMQNNKDEEYFSQWLERTVQEVSFSDPGLWLDRPETIADKNELLEIKHELIIRRQKIRKQIQENTRAVKSERREIDRLMKEHNYYVPEILEIINSVDRLCGLNRKR